MARSVFRNGAPGYESGQKTRGGLPQVFALVILRICVGVYMFFFGFEKSAWLLDATPVAAQLSSWLVDASPASRWYLERVIPGAPLFARLVPLASMAGGAGLVFGLWTRIAAGAVAGRRAEPSARAPARCSGIRISRTRAACRLTGALIALIIGGERGAPKGKTL